MTDVGYYRCPRLGCGYVDEGEAVADPAFTERMHAHIEMHWCEDNGIEANDPRLDEAYEDGGTMLSNESLAADGLARAEVDELRREAINGRWGCV